MPAGAEYAFSGSVRFPGTEFRLCQNRPRATLSFEPFMQRNPASNNPLWRSLVGCLVAYALIINALLSGVVGAEWAAQAAAGLLGEHCLTDARAAAPDPAPAGQPDDSSHCAFCTLASPPVVLPAMPPAASIIAPRPGAPWGASDRDLILRLGHPGQLPRGPPRRA
jgi:hypothetical protein